MSDELARWKGLKLNQLDKPYFVQYSLADTYFFRAVGSLGGLTEISHQNQKIPVLQVRVGSYASDNTNAAFTRFPPYEKLPEDGNYAVSRHRLWLATDQLYKAAANQYAYKRNLMAGESAPDKTPDFARAAPVQLLQPAATDTSDGHDSAWSAEVQRLSHLFANYRNVMDSEVALRSIDSTFRLVNTEGTMVRIPQTLHDLTITSGSYASDGSRVWNHRFLTYLEASNIPGEQEISAIVRATAAETEALAASKAAEDYTGPVLFEGESAGQMMSQTLADTIRLHRKPLTPPGQPGSEMLESVWASRIGTRVLPDWMSLVDDPAARDLNGLPLAGQYDVDDEGVKAQRVTVVEGGMLKAFLLSREPVRNFNQSNGHGRLPGPFGSYAAAISNLFVNVTGGVPEAKLREHLLARVTAAGLPFGYVIRRIDYPSTSSREDLQAMVQQMQKGGYARTLGNPLLAYRVYQDGHEELVRGLHFKEFSAKDLHDISAASDHPVVFSFVNNGSTFNHIDMAGSEVTSSIICPSLLLESVDLSKTEGQSGHLPLVASPPVGRK